MGHITCDGCGKEILPNHRLIINGDLRGRIKARFAGEGLPKVSYFHKKCVPDSGGNRSISDFV